MDPNNILMLLTDLVHQDRSLPIHIIDFSHLKPLTGEGGSGGQGPDLKTFSPLWWSQVNVKALSSLDQNLRTNIDLGPT